MIGTIVLGIGADALTLVRPLVIAKDLSECRRYATHDRATTLLLGTKRIEGVTLPPLNIVQKRSHTLRT